MDLNTLIHSALTVVDATTCALHWELGGDPIKLDTIIMSENILAVDMIAASLLGYGIDEVRHLKIANESGLGPTSMKEIKVYNSPDTETRKMVVDVSQKKGPEYKLRDLKIIEKGTVVPAREPLPPKEQLIYQDGKFAIEF